MRTKSTYGQQNLLCNLFGKCAGKKPDAKHSTRKWINHIALNLLTVEHHIDAFLESQGEAPEKTKNKKLDKILNDLMISGNEIIPVSIKNDTGVPGSPPGSANDPSPRLVETANKWVIDARAIISKNAMNSLGVLTILEDFQTLGWVIGNKSHKFNALIETIASRLKRIGEYLSS